jgi:hypothetical protein
MVHKSNSFLWPNTRVLVQNVWQVPRLFDYLIIP